MSLQAWGDDLATVALIGTARRPLPERPAGAPAARPDATAEVALLDGLAVSAALRRAGTRPGSEDDGARDPAAEDELPAPSARARQLLDLLLTQPPVGQRLAPYALRVWLRAAAEHGRRCHHPALVALLDAATGNRLLRDVTVPVLDRRGAWLARANPRWAWALPTTDGRPEAVDQQEWARRPTLERVVQVRETRAHDPAAGRVLVESTWASDPAPARAELLGALEVGLSLDDEPLLERALDDRAAGVRDTAYRLLDGLPGSARAGRLGELLAPLLGTSGLLRRKVQVELPEQPDQVGVRDGLAKAPAGRSQRGFWLQRLAAGAPYDAWTAGTGLAPASVVAGLEDADALAGLRTATVARGDVVWARALLDRAWDPGLARLLPPDEAAVRMLRRVDEVTTVPDLASALRLSPGPWTEAVSMRVLARLERLERHPHVLADLVPLLAEGLHPRTAPTVERLAVTGAGPTDPMHQLAQYLMIVPTITEAFR